MPFECYVQGSLVNKYYPSQKHLNCRSVLFMMQQCVWPTLWFCVSNPLFPLFILFDLQSYLIKFQTKQPFDFILLYLVLNFFYYYIFYLK